MGESLQEIAERLAYEKSLKQLSPVLAKSLDDPHRYTIQIRSGEVIVFESAVLHGQWLQLMGVTWNECSPTFNRVRSDRGIDVRISEIVWAIDSES